MQWLIANIWMALAAFGVLGVLFGAAMRGLFSENKVRRARVDRDIAKTELDQTRLELDELYAAQRKRQNDSSQAVSGDDNMATELAEREAKITGLGDELTAARSELDALKAERESGGWSGKDAAGAATAAAAGAIGGTALAGGGDDDATKALEERNTWLEERVAALETEISTTPAVSADSDGETGIEKLQWQNDHLRQRVEALEGEIAALPASRTADNDGDGSSEDDEELARLRWRNRYLEKQVAYHEGGEEGAAADDDGKGGLIAGAATAVGAALVSDPEEVVEDQDEEIADAVDEIAGNAVEAADDTVEEALEDAESFEDVVDDIAQTDEHPSDAVLKELGDEIEAVEVDQVQPEQVDAPADGGGDDLTEIVGVGPRIAEVLNELGIWSFGQIAAWTPENAAWVEQHLSFKGRVEREGWIEQARDLLDSDKA